MSEPPGAFFKHLLPMVGKIRLEPIEYAERHSTAFAGDHFHLPINPLLRVHTI
jgi:hypothetical protein